MSKSLNQVTILGNLGGDPEVRSIPNGTSVCNFTVATSEQWKDKESGEMKESTEWHRVVAWGKLAEIAGEYLNKGGKVLVQGSLQTRKWEDKNGVEKYTTEIKANSLILLGGKSDPHVPASEDEPAEQVSKPAAKKPGGKKLPF